MILYVKSRFVIIARGVQLDNGVDPPWSIWVDCMVMMTIRMVLSYARRMFWYPNSLYDICVLYWRCIPPDLVVLPSIWPLEFLVGGFRICLCVCIVAGRI